MIFSFLTVIFFCICYVISGQSHKWIRRYLGAGIFGLSIWLITYLHHNFGWLPFIAGAWYIPSLIIFKYGVNDGNVAKKILLRGIYGASLGLGGLLVGIATGHLVLGIIQVVLATVASIFFGVVNPFSKLGDKGVMIEDFFISASCVALIPFMVA